MSQFYQIAQNPLGHGSERCCLRQTIKFERSFSKEPKLVVSLTMIDSSSSANLRLEAHPENIAVDGFDLVCCTWADSIIYAFDATWTAYEN